MNPLFQSMNQKPDISGLLALLKNGNPEMIAMQMMQSNPRFAAFMQQNQGKTPEQVAKENGLDLGMYMDQMK